MRRLSAFIANPANQLRWWAFWTVAWLVLDPITMLTPLRHSVPWVNQESLFANFASCGTAWVAAMSYLRARRVDEANLHAKIDRLQAHTEAIAEHHGVTVDR